MCAICFGTPQWTSQIATATASQVLPLSISSLSLIHSLRRCRDQTATEVAAILIKRKKGASVLSGKQFEELCGKLEQKYGEAPADVWRESQQKPPEDNAAPSDSDDDYSEAFDDGIMPMRSPQQACVREPDPEPALSREEAARRRKELMAEIEKTEKTMFSWESIVASQTENREYLQQSLDGLTKRLSDLRTEFAALETMYSRASSGQHARSGVWCNVVESTVIHAPVPQVWSAIKAMDFAWSSTVSTVRDCVAPMGMYRAVSPNRKRKHATLKVDYVPCCSGQIGHCRLRLVRWSSLGNFRGSPF